MARCFVLETQLMRYDRPATWALAHYLGGDALVELIRTESRSCYLGDRTHLHEWGHCSDDCPACDLPAPGWRKWWG